MQITMIMWQRLRKQSAVMWSRKDLTYRRDSLRRLRSLLHIVVKNSRQKAPSNAAKCFPFSDADTLLIIRAIQDAMLDIKGSRILAANSDHKPLIIRLAEGYLEYAQRVISNDTVVDYLAGRLRSEELTYSELLHFTSSVKVVTPAEDL